MSQRIIKKFIQANVHIGKKAVNPAMFPYIRGFRNESSIFDLSQTLKCCRHLFQFFNVLSMKRHHILFFNTRPELNNLTLFIAKHLNQSAIVDQWTGGTLTNWKQMKKTALFFSATAGKKSIRLGLRPPHFVRSKARFAPLRSPIIRQFQSICDSFPRLKKSRKLFQYFRKQYRPNFVVVLDPNNSEYAIHEAYSLKLPITAFVDSDTPSAILKKITFPIPSNNRCLQFMYWVLNSLVLIRKKNQLQKKNTGGGVAPTPLCSTNPAQLSTLRQTLRQVQSREAAKWGDEWAKKKK